MTPSESVGDGRIPTVQAAAKVLRRRSIQALSCVSFKIGCRRTVDRGYLFLHLGVGQDCQLPQAAFSQLHDQTSGHEQLVQTVSRILKNMRRCLLDKGKIDKGTEVPIRLPEEEDAA
jgi:hypothetical protein